MAGLTRREALAAMAGVGVGAAATGGSVGAVWLLSNDNEDDRLYSDWSPEIARTTGRPTLDGDAVIGLVPDTQLYAQYAPEIYRGQMDWLAEHADYVIHLGDMVDHGGSLLEWGRASNAHRVLDQAGVPYGLGAGNHDDVHGYSESYLSGPWHHYRQQFPLARVDGDGATVVSSHDGPVNYVHRVTLGERDWLVVFLAFAVDPYPLEWVHGVLDAHSDLPAILVNHPWMHPSGERTSHGDTLAELPATHDNVRLVVGGHTFAPDQPFIRHVERDAHEVMANFQTIRRPDGTGGEGWLCTITLRGTEARLETYSTLHDVIPENDYYRKSLSL